ncbi:MAG TPA: hemin uptake protein HemP [Gemmatales bacterium]|nr:hemin uptake protein HemP [Gemmatales bacterium]HMP60965.1 hemin uptake protein HemP [Gemmatales bacterium]
MNADLLERIPDVDADDEPTAAAAAPSVDSHCLFQGQREILIDHDGVCYRLRITRRNKLILQK